jgi:hypothetical protein
MRFPPFKLVAKKSHHLHQPDKAYAITTSLLLHHLLPLLPFGQIPQNHREQYGTQCVPKYPCLESCLEEYPLPILHNHHTFMRNSQKSLGCWGPLARGGPVLILFTCVSLRPRTDTGVPLHYPCGSSLSKRHFIYMRVIKTSNRYRSAHYMILADLLLPSLGVRHNWVCSACALRW